MTLTAYIGTVAAFCTTVAFVPQIVKLRKQGGEDLSYQMLFLYLTGVVLWLAYGVRVHAVAVIWANALSVIMVLISIVLKANPPASKLNPGSNNFASRRLRIAVDMDEVIADSFSKHLNRYNQRTGAKLTPELVASKGLSSLISSDRWDVFAGIPHEDGFFADLELIEGSREALLQLSKDHDVYIASAAMEVPYSFDANIDGCRRTSLSFPPAELCFAGTRTSSTPMC